MLKQIDSESSARGAALEEDIRTVYERRLTERNRALEVWTWRDHRVGDARLLAFLALVVLGVLIVRGAGIALW